MMNFGYGLELFVIYLVKFIIVGNRIDGGYNFLFFVEDIS